MAAQKKAGISVRDKRLASRFCNHLLGDAAWFSKLQRKLFMETQGRLVLQTRSQLTSWLSTVDQSTRGDGKRKRLRGQGPSNDGISAALFEWYSGLRRDNHRVTVAATKRKAEALTGGPVARYWFYRWCMRNDVVLRKIQRRSQHSLETIRSYCQSFHQYLYRIRSEQNVTILINLDEVPFSFSGGLKSGTTLCQRGATDVITSEDPKWDKRCASFVAIIGVIKRGAQWENLPLKCAVLLRRTAKKPWLIQNPHRWLITESPSGVVTGTYMSNYVAPYIRSQLATLLSPGEKAVVIMDSATGHLTDASKAAFKAFSHFAVIPGGMTQFL